MNLSKKILLSVASVCVALLGAALYLQIVEKMLPCPLCVFQRYAFAFIAIFCLIAVATQGLWHRITTGLALLSAMVGVGVAGKHIWVLANPELSCGIDPLETGLNKIFLAQIWPTMFRADGLCETPYPPSLGLSLPAWAAIWFSIFILTLLFVFIRNQKTQRGMFGPSR
ncbi:disulfide bond formation protein B [Undibacterium sp. TJN19]|uniref:disulfide bond formation protein B n=1 Tax=Undibacterium sp. TJN19 TaxID=3413055 RepID=UPI003BF3DA74